MSDSRYNNLDSYERELAARLQKRPELRRNLIANHPLQGTRPIPARTLARKLVAHRIAVQRKARYGQIELLRGPDWETFFKAERGRIGAEFRAAAELNAKMCRAYDMSIARLTAKPWRLPPPKGGRTIRLVHSRQG